MTNDEFEKWWGWLSDTLKPNTEVHHWSAESNFLPGSFCVSSVAGDGIWIDISKPALPARHITKKRYKSQEALLCHDPEAQEVPVPRQHFLKKESFYAALIRWNDYRRRIITRETLETQVYNSTYVISIIRWTDQ